MTRQQLADDLRAMTAEDPIQFLYDGGSYVGGWSGIRHEEPLEMGGVTPRPQASLMIPLLDTFGNPTFEAGRPDVGDVITISGRQLKVDTWETDPMQAGMTLNLVSI